MGPTVLTVTSEGSVLARSARTWRTSSCLPSDEAGPCTRRVSVPTIWILAWPSPTLSSAERASTTVTPGALTSQETPPSKSMPRLSPRVNSDSTLITMRTAERITPRRHHFRKLMSFSPR